MNMAKWASAVLVLMIYIVVLGGCASTHPKNIGKVNRSPLNDGVYEGRFQEGPVKVVAKVTISGQKINGIELIEHRNWMGGKAETVIVERIIAEQSTRVDAVSGATQSSRVIMNAVQGALDKAGK